MNKLAVNIILGILLLPMTVLAQETTPTETKPPAASITLDVKTAVKMAGEHSYSLQGTALDLTTQRNAAQGSFSLFYPSASLSGTFQMGSNEAAGTVADANKLSVGASVGVSLTPVMALQVKQLWNAYQAGQLTYEQARAKLAVAVKKYYYGLILSRDQLDLLRKQADAASQRLKTAEYKLSLGLIAPVDKLSVEYAYKNALYALKSAENTYRINLLQLLQVCGIDGSADVTLSDGIPNAPALPAGTDTTAVADNIDLRLLQVNKNAAEIQRDIAVTSLLPVVTLSVEAGRAYQIDPFSQSLFSGGDWAATGSAALKFAINVPLDSYLPYSGAWQTLAAKDAALRQAELSIMDKTETARQQAETDVLTLQQIESQLESLAVNIQMAEQNLTLIEQLYNSGKKSFLDVKDAENSAFSARVQLANAKYNYIAALLDLGYLLNRDFGY